METFGALLVINVAKKRLEQWPPEKPRVKTFNV